MNDYTALYAVIIPVSAAILVCAVLVISAGIIEITQLRKANKNLGKWMKELHEEGKSPKQRRKELRRLK